MRISTVGYNSARARVNFDSATKGKSQPQSVGHAIISATYPNGWQISTPRKEGVNLFSVMPDDGSVLWQGIWLVRGASTMDQGLELLDNVPDRMFSDITRTGESSHIRIGDLDVVKLQATGTYKNTGPVEFFIYLSETSGQRIGAMAYMGRPGAIEQHRLDPQALLRSLTSAGG